MNSMRYILQNFEKQPFLQLIDQSNSTIIADDDRVHLSKKQCYDVTVNKYKGAILSDCHRLIGQVGERRSHCIYVKRTLPYKACCEERSNGEKSIAVNDQLSSRSQLLPCTKYQEVESKFCFDVPVEQREQCNRQLISDKCHL